MTKRILKKFMKLIDHQSKTQQKENEIPCITGLIKFSPFEIKEMADPFKSEFIRSGLIARVIKSLCGYEIRYIRNGYKRIVFHENLEEAKHLFCEGGNV